MILTDTHCHLYSSEFDADRPQMIKRSIDAGIERMFLPNVDIESIEGMKQLINDYPDNCFPMMGLHPCSVGEDYKEILEKIYKELTSNEVKYLAVGEIGIDLHWNKTTYEWQKEAFEMQCRWALQRNLPIVIHSRNANRESIDIVKSFSSEGIRGIFHCFSGTAEEAKEIVGLGFYLGIGGVLTYKNSGLADAIKDIALENMVLETDAPYLAPVPFRGKRNESAYIENIAMKLAEILNVSIEEVARITTENSVRIFGR